ARWSRRTASGCSVARSSGWRPASGWWPWRLPGLGSLRRELLLLGKRVVLEEGIGQREGLHVGRQRRVDDEAHRHVAPLAGVQRLGGEAEALGLAEVARRARRRDRGHRAADDGAVAVVVRV